MASGSDYLQTSRIDDDDINLLLLGETGVGKSTFINSMVNYLQHATLDDALEENLTCLIPSKFSISDENYQTQEVHIGSDKNEDRKIGNSSTQGARSYAFPIRDYSTCRLIDTPGIGDARGLDKDRENFENLLMYISQYKYLHGICFLLKPNVTVINPYFKFCIIHLLSRLEKSASRNIIFIFTNSRGTFYRPGETLTLLRRVLAEIEESPPHVKIPCDKENIFCVDNEAFKFLAAMKQGIKFGEREKDEFSKSWETSCDAVISLMKYVQGPKKQMPHQVQNTLSINEARRNILDLAKPLADITEYIRNNLILLDRHTKELSEEHLTNEELKQRLYVPGITIQAVELNQPVTVCSSAKCSELVSQGGISQRHYKQRCHNPCHLTGVPKEIIGTAELYNCYAMSGGTCRFCGCNFKVHMHIYYETETKQIKQEDKHVKSQIMSREDLILKKNEIIKESKQKAEEYEKEKQTILKTMAKFAFFLNENSISPYNDAYLQYLNYLIEREKSLGENADKQLLSNYNELKITYQAEMDILNVAKQKASKQSSKFTLMSIAEVFDSIKSLFNLHWTGKTIEDFYTKQRKLKKQEVFEKEYLHPKPLRIIYDLFTGNRGKGKKDNGKSGSNSGNCSNCSECGTKSKWLVPTDLSVLSKTNKKSILKSRQNIKSKSGKVEVQNSADNVNLTKQQMYGHSSQIDTTALKKESEKMNYEEDSEESEESGSKPKGLVPTDLSVLSKTNKQSTLKPRQNIKSKLGKVEVQNSGHSSQIDTTTLNKESEKISYKEVSEESISAETIELFQQFLKFNKNQSNVDVGNTRVNPSDFQQNDDDLKQNPIKLNQTPDKCNENPDDSTQGAVNSPNHTEEEPPTYTEIYGASSSQPAVQPDSNNRESDENSFGDFEKLSVTGGDE